MQKIHLIARLERGFIYLIILYNTTKRKNPPSHCERGGKGQEVIVVVPFPLVAPCHRSVAPAPHRRRSSPSLWCQSSPMSWYPLIPFACLSSGCGERRLPAQLPVTSSLPVAPVSTPRAVAHGGGWGCCCCGWWWWWSVVVVPILPVIIVGSSRCLLILVVIHPSSSSSSSLVVLVST
jgi:hypothetical protein